MEDDMKTLLRNDLWLMMIAYSLFLYGFEVIGLITCIVGIIYEIVFSKNVNFWRVVSISIIYTLLEYILVYFSNISTIYSLIYPFLILMNIDLALSLELLTKVNKGFLELLDVLVFGFILITVLLIAIMPDTPLIPYIKNDMYIYTVIIFVPTFININVSLLSKAHLRKMAKA